MALNSKLTGDHTPNTWGDDDDAMLWETAKAAAKQILYIAMILGAGVLIVLSVMVSIFTMPFREGYK